LLLIEACRSDAAAAYMKEQLARKSKSKPWNVYIPSLGDTVMAYDLTGDRSFDTAYKLKARWKGPYIVCEVGRRLVRLKTIEGNPRNGWVSWSMVKRYRIGRDTTDGEDEQEGGREGEDRGPHGGERDLPEGTDESEYEDP
jgi:hypothetical protein